MTDPGAIEVRPAGAGFEVVLVPPDPAHPPRTFDNHRNAYGYAGGLRMVLGRRRVDLTEH